MVKIKKSQLAESRKEIAGGIVEHTYEIPVGSGQFDRLKFTE
jgi:hypothetical protein